MSMRGRCYRYVGPVDLEAVVRPGSGGCRIGSPTDFGVRVAERSAAEPAEPFTFVIGVDGVLLLAPRRSEHVVCAGGGVVLSAGEISFAREAGRWAPGRLGMTCRAVEQFAYVAVPEVLYDTARHGGSWTL
ncbi:hypothetical protein ABWJ92_33840 [Streptomyces sp. NPDC000609]|uniref:hypothetical protein n=1 Tax=Streptomyces sp. NPDC000609 TaxID=3160957 RepID=UPI0033979B45